MPKLWCTIPYLIWVYYDFTNKSFKCYVIQLLHCIKGSAIVYHVKFALISNEISSFIRFNIDALQFFQVKASVTWFSIAMNWKVILAFSNVHWRDTSFLNNLLTPWITFIQLNYSVATRYNSVATHYNCNSTTTLSCNYTFSLEFCAITPLVVTHYYSTATRYNSAATLSVTLLQLTTRI